MAIFLPVYITVGRALLGSLGWLTLIFVFTIVPIIFVAQVTIWLLIRLRSDVKQSGRASAWDARAMLTFYGSAILFGVFVVDGGDTEESIRSVASNFLGQGFNVASSILAMAFGVVAAVSLLAALVISVMEFIEDRKHRSATVGGPIIEMKK